MQGLPETSLLGRLKRAGIGDDTFGAGVGIEVGGRRESVGDRWHPAGSLGRESTWLVGVRGSEGGTVVVGARAGVFGVGGGGGALIVDEGVELVLGSC